MRTWIEISEAALAHNLHALQQAAGAQTEVLAVVKANAYGHGAELCAQTLARAGAHSFGVTDAAEGARVRRALQRSLSEHTPEILVMCGSLRDETRTLAEHSLTPVVWTTAQISALGDLPHKKIQVEIDTGMGRQGAQPGPELDALLAATRTANLDLDGVFTHLCASEVAHSTLTHTQMERFEQAIAQVRAHGLQPKWVHIGNSSTLDNIDPAGPTSAWLTRLAHSVGAQPMVRTGLALYGYVLPIVSTCEAQWRDGQRSDPQAAPQHAPEAAPPATRATLRPHLQPVLTWKARILATDTLAPGDTVGYGATFTATEPIRVALLPVGYADGLRRELSNPSPNSLSNTPSVPHPSEPGADRCRPAAGGWVIAHAPHRTPHRCPILGRISMNLTVIDISAVPTLGPGDPVILLGKGITAEDHARLAATIPYEILCGLKPPQFPR